MTDNQSNTVDYILNIINKHNINVPNLALDAGIQYTNLNSILNKKRPIGDGTIIKLSKALNISYDILKNPPIDFSTAEEEVKYDTIRKNTVEHDKGKFPKLSGDTTEIIHQTGGYLPYYKRDVTASQMIMFEDGTIPPTSYYFLPDFSDCTAIFPIYGDSMLPRFRAGDKVIVKEVTHFHEYIQFGEVFLVFTRNEERMIKIIRRSDRQGYIKLTSINASYDDFEIPLNIITKLFMVKGKISIEND